MSTGLKTTFTANAYARRPLPKSFQRATGFAEQMDIHEPTATVRESLQFSALLRQPKEVPIKEKYEYCEKIIDLLEMRPIAGAIVGEGGAGLNAEQRKRLTIAVELASKPQLLLFLDEPTSGLDSLAAYNIVRFLRRLADAGQAILCTIHQPSAVLFEQFDELLLLQSGGRVVYNNELGTDSKKLIEYFEQNGARKCSPHENPAEVASYSHVPSYTMLTCGSICSMLSAPVTPITKGRTGVMSGPDLLSTSRFRKRSRISSRSDATGKLKEKKMTIGNMQCPSGCRY